MRHAGEANEDFLQNDFFRFAIWRSSDRALRNCDAVALDECPRERNALLSGDTLS